MGNVRGQVVVLDDEVAVVLFLAVTLRDAVAGDTNRVKSLKQNLKPVP